jgi:cytochrome c oxidase cbb3-type subunit 3
MSQIVDQPPPEEKLTDHLYDGIREYDNPLPGWWTWLFILSIVFSFFYWIYFQLGTPGRSIHDQLDAQAAAIFELKFAEIGTLVPDRETIVKYMHDDKFRAVGKAIFKANCVSCHGANGEGNVGPNLTDERWKNVKQIEDIARVIENGAANGAMPAWRTRLSHINKIVLTAAYVASLRGSNPPGGKPPEPEAVPIPPWPELPAAPAGNAADAPPTAAAN